MKISKISENSPLTLACIVCALFMISTISADAQTVYRMLYHFMNDDEIQTSAAGLELKLFEQIDDRINVLVLRVAIKNDFDRSICVPMNLHGSGPGITSEKIMRISLDDGAKVEPSIYYHMIWPTNRYIVLVPGGSDRTNIDLSKFFYLDEDVRKLNVSYSVPAFFCDVLKEGYPVTEDLVDYERGLAKIGPLKVITHDDVVVFKGEERLKIED